MTNFPVIITSISNSDNQILKTWGKKAKDRNQIVYLIGDRKSPRDFNISGIEFYSIENQKKLPFKFARLLPENHYSRKNLGYLIAIKERYKIIVETDDDNIPYSSFWQPRILEHQAISITNCGWVNIYSEFTNENIWPRGFPLEKIKEQNELHKEKKKITAPIQQGLADLNPDVDAVYRMTGKLPVKFKKNHKIALGPGSFCPFNSQNTTWFSQAFPLMYLPSYCSFRMTDIWRSFIAQIIAYHYGWHILFHSPTVYQERNEHNLLRDFEMEIPGYLNNDRIINSLIETELTNDIYENLFRLYKVMINNHWIEEKELFLLEAWIEDIQKFDRQ